MDARSANLVGTGFALFTYREASAPSEAAKLLPLFPLFDGFRRTIPLDGKPVTSIKEFVVLTGRMCKGLINWKHNVHVPTKQACPILFSQYFNNQPAEAFSEISHYCREQFHYLIPETDEDKNRLQWLLPKAVAIENFFLSQYQDFLIENLANPDPQKVCLSIKRLGEVIFPNNSLYRLYPR